MKLQRPPSLNAYLVAPADHVDARVFRVLGRGIAPLHERDCPRFPLAGRPRREVGESCSVYVNGG